MRSPSIPNCNRIRDEELELRLHPSVGLEVEVEDSNFDVICPPICGPNESFHLRSDIANEEWNLFLGFHFPRPRVEVMVVVLKNALRGIRGKDGTGFQGHPTDDRGHVSCSRPEPLKHQDFCQKIFILEYCSCCTLINDFLGE